MAQATLVIVAALGGLAAGWSVHRATGALSSPVRLAAIVLTATLAAAAAYATALMLLLLIFGFGP